MALGFLDAAKNRVIGMAASTSLAKTYAIRPELESYLAVSDTELLNAKVTLAGIESLNKAPALKKTLNELTQSAENILQEVRTNGALDTIADIIGNHVSDFDSVQAFKEALPKMKAIQAMINFTGGLIDIAHYKQLGELLKSLQNFSNLEKPEQTKLLKALDDKTLITAIRDENKKLNIKSIHKDITKMAKDLCKELKLTKEESAALIKIFEKLTTAHLTKLNTIREALIKQLPAFLTLEQERVLKQHPELIVHKESKPVSILAQFKQCAEKVKTKVAGKRPIKKSEDVATDKGATKKIKR